MKFLIDGQIGHTLRFLVRFPYPTLMLILCFKLIGGSIVAHSELCPVPDLLHQTPPSFPGILVFNSYGGTSQGGFSFLHLQNNQLISDRFPVPDVGYLALSPDGEWIVGTEESLMPNAVVDVSLFSRDGAEARLLFDDFVRPYSYVDWLQDDTIFMMWWEENPNGFGALTVNPFVSPARLTIPEWSMATDLQIVFVVPQAGLALGVENPTRPTEKRYYVYNLGDERRIEVPAMGMSLAWATPGISLDGRVAYSLMTTLSPVTGEYNDEIYIFNPSTGNVFQTTSFGNQYARTHIFNDLLWSPSGQYIAFEMKQSNSREYPSTRAQLYILNVERGTISHFCVPTSSVSSPYIWSPDSQYIAYYDETSRLLVVDVLTGQTYILEEGVYGISDWVEN